MDVPKAWIKILCLISLFGLVFTNIDSKENFCGKKLVRTLTELCSIYNNPTFVHNRFRRQIVDECCRSQCSRRYLIQYYCSEVNSSIAILLKSKPENSSKTAHEKDSKIPHSDTTSSPGEKNSLNVGSNAEDQTNQRALARKNEPLSSNHNRITTHNSKCRCRKRRAQRIKKIRRMQSARNMIHQPVPPANIGQVEHSQKPFYVWKFSQVY